MDNRKLIGMKTTLASSRREVLRLATAGVGAATLHGLYGSAALAAKPGGAFRLGVAGMSAEDSHDPAKFGTSGSDTLGLWGAVYNNLVEIAPNGELVGELAESWEPTDDAKAWRFKLRDGVEFHNGKTMDSEDVIASINYHRGPDSTSAAKSIVDPIVDVRADGPNVVVIELGEGNADFPYISTDYHLVIGPVMSGKIDWEAAIGTGGYVLKTHERGVRMDLLRNANYWKPDRAHFDEAHLIGIGDQSAKQNALVTGQVDAIDEVDFKGAKFLGRNADIVIEEVTGTQHFTIPMFTDVAPFDNNDVRLALKYAIDREAIISRIIDGHAIPGNDHPITPANRFYANDIPIREHDPDKAKFHLRKAGYDSLDVTLSASDAPFVGAVDMALMFKEQASKTGINIDVVREPVDSYWNDVWTKKPFVMCYWGGRPTEDWMFSLVYAKGAPWNDTHWDNPRFNELLVQARSELNDVKRREMYHEMQLLVRDQGGVIVPAYANYIFARSNKIARGDSIASNWSLDGWKCIERWWFA